MSQMLVDGGGGNWKQVEVEYPANSQKSKEPKKVERVTTGEVVQRKRGLFKRASESLTEDTTQGVVEYIVADVLVPAAKSLISDIVTQGIERLLYGDARPRSSGRPGYTSYNKVRNATSAYSERRELSRQQRARHEFDDIILGTRGEAEDVLDRLRDLVDKYDVATVADLYDLVGISGEFTDDKWGWYDLKNAGVRNVRGGYLVVLPKTQPIE